MSFLPAQGINTYSTILTTSHLISESDGLYQGTTFSRAEWVGEKSWALAPADAPSGAKAQVLEAACGTAEAVP